MPIPVRRSRPECGQRVHGPKQMEFKMVFISKSYAIRSQHHWLEQAAKA